MELRPNTRHEAKAQPNYWSHAVTRVAAVVSGQPLARAAGNDHISAAQCGRECLKQGKAGDRFFLETDFQRMFDSSEDFWCPCRLSRLSCVGDSGVVPHGYNRSWYSEGDDRALRSSFGLISTGIVEIRRLMDDMVGRQLQDQSLAIPFAREEGSDRRTRISAHRLEHDVRANPTVTQLLDRLRLSLLAFGAQAVRAGPLGSAAAATELGVWLRRPGWELELGLRAGVQKSEAPAAGPSGSGASSSPHAGRGTCCSRACPQRLRAA
jgi:hypothetical protein